MFKTNKTESKKIKNFEEIFPWQEFYERYVNNFEEFCFKYKNQYIHLITDTIGFLYNIGTKEKGYKNSKIYDSPEEVLENAKFDGKTLKEIWNELS